MDHPAAALLPTPIGPLAVVVDAEGTVLAAGFTPLDALARRRGLPPDLPVADEAALRPVTTALRAYLAGDLAALERVRVEQRGTAFQQRVWARLRAVPAGEPTTYAALSRDVDAPAAARAVGQACGANLAAPFVPCHRVVPAGGGVGGYAYGVEVKTWLLAHEADHRPAVSGGRRVGAAVPDREAVPDPQAVP
jgi:methylated-DNA-[protein]-cysteine S-methyltransferase